MSLVSENSSILSCAVQMQNENQSSCLVLSGEQSLLGILTERDILVRVVHPRRPSTGTMVCTVMTRSPDTAAPGDNALSALRAMATRRYRHLPVVGADGRPVGVIDLMEVAQGGKACPEGGRAVVLPETATVTEAVRGMVEGVCGAVVIGAARGILSERDVVRRVVAKGLDPETTLVSAVMTRNPITVTQGTSADKVLEIMRKGGFRHLPVVDKASNVVSLIDILHIATAPDQQHAATAAAQPAAAKSKGWGLSGLFSALSSAFSNARVLDTYSDSEDSEVSEESEEQGQKHTVGELLEVIKARNLQQQQQQHHHHHPIAAATTTTSSSSAATHSFKFKDSHGAFHRVTLAASATLADLAAKVEAAVGKVAYLRYVDDDGDEVALGTEADLAECLALCETQQWKVIKLVAGFSLETAPSPLELETEGNALVQDSRFAEALQVYTRARAGLNDATESHHCARILTKRATVLAILDRADEAAADLAAIVDMHASGKVTGEVVNSARFSMAELMLERGKVQEAVAEFAKVEGPKAEQARRALSAEAEARRAEADKAASEGDWDAAIKALSVAVLVVPTASVAAKAEVLTARSKAHEKAGDHDSALEDSQAAVAIAPDSVDALIQLGRCQAHQGSTAEAKQTLRSARTRDPTNKTIARELAMLRDENDALPEVPADQVEGKISALAGLMKSMQRT
jgi:CBS domain-containing protein/tetratricopeptide (TPR) repeat protein